MVAQPSSPALVETADGSLTLRSAAHGETYHSCHGARQESLHVFIRAAGLVDRLASTAASVLEIGFGTGLNLGIALDLLGGRNATLRYVGFEPFPPPADARRAVLAASGISSRTIDIIDQLVDRGRFRDAHRDLTLRFAPFAAPVPGAFDVIWHDAFSPPNAPELWTAEVLFAEYQSLRPGGVWVSYCARGAVRRTLQRVGFLVERLPGPPGKREMLRATRPA